MQDPTSEGVWTGRPWGPGGLVLLADQPVTRLHRDPLGARGSFTGSPPADSWHGTRLGVCLLSSLVLLPRPPHVQAFLPLTPGPCSPGCSCFLWPWQLKFPMDGMKDDQGHMCLLGQRREIKLLPALNQIRATRKSRMCVWGSGHTPDLRSYTSSFTSRRVHRLLPFPPGIHSLLPSPRCAQGPVSPEPLASPFTPKGSITPDAPSLAYRYISRGQFSGWWGSSDSEALLALCMSSRDQGSVPPAPADHLPLREGWQVWSLKRASGEPCGQKALASCGRLVQSNLKIPCLCVCAVSSRLSKLHPF